MSVKVRNPIIENMKIKIIRPKYFFHRCRKCQNEFRGAVMWSWRVYDWDGGSGREYACMDCVEQLADLYKLALTKHELELVLGGVK